MVDKDKIIKKLLLLEKSFFDLDEPPSSDDKTDTDTDTDTDTTDDVDSGGDENTNETTGNFSLQHKLQLKLLYSSIRNIMELSRFLANNNKDKFEPIYENYQRLYDYLKDYVLNFNDIDDAKRVKLLRLFREAFLTINKQFVEKLKSL